MLTFAIVNWNGGDVLKQCVTSIQAAVASLPESCPFEIVIVDNASDDFDEEWALAQQNTIIIRNKKNLLFAKATNQSIQHARGNLLFILNNDIILERDTLRLLLADLEHYNCDAVVPRLFYPDGTPQISLAGIPTLRDIVLASMGLTILVPRWNRWLSPRVDYSKSQELAVQPQFSAVLMRRTTWETVGELDEHFPLFWNDVDWFFRFYQKGLRCFLVAPAKAIHHHGMSTRKIKFRKVKMSIDSLRKFFRKHYRIGPLGILVLYISSSVLFVLALLLEIWRMVRRQLLGRKNITGSKVVS